MSKLEFYPRRDSRRGHCSGSSRESRFTVQESDMALRNRLIGLSIAAFCVAGCGEDGIPDSSRSLGEDCEASINCEGSLVCEYGYCGYQNLSGYDGMLCEESIDCIGNLLCQGGICWAPACRSANAACTSNSDCCVGACVTDSQGLNAACADPCTAGSDCVSGCCAQTTLGASVCAAATYCQ
jgi:hypothetical protein